MRWSSFNRKRLNEHILTQPPPMQSEDEHRHHHIMDDITHGQWSKNYYDKDKSLVNHNQGEDKLDPYDMQQNSRKIAKKLSRL
jgi:hypothetical protein